MRHQKCFHIGKIGLIIFVTLLFSSCERDSVDSFVESESDGYQIMTVNGPISSAQLGYTLPHEHVLVDWIGADGTGYHRWNRVDVVSRMKPFFEEVRDLGMQSIFECTPAYLGRDPFILRELSEATGIQFVTNTGYYGAVDNHFMPAHAWEESAEELASRWIDEFENGINGSDIRPGFMKISVAGEGSLSELHRKIVTAAAYTHMATGMTIISHTTGNEPAVEQVDLLESLGVAPSAWVWTHAQAGDLDTQLTLGKKGAWISLDNFNYNPDREDDDPGNLDWFRKRLMELRNEGLLDQVLISHDAGYYNPDEEDGGEIRGYTDIWRYLLPALLEDGFHQEEISQLLIQNPADAFGIRVRMIDNQE